MGRYKEVLTYIASILGLRVEEKVLTRPKDAVEWTLSTKDIAYQLYVTNAPKGKETPSFSFGFWRYGETEDEVYKTALMHLIPSLKWTYKMRLKKWLHLK